jgi:DNA helicase-2/ATP-dependent DNA helicase PcrA
MIEITSDTRLPNPDINFRVSAGPGAGKTHWLVHHILEIIKQPERLGKNRKLACLTYTNIGADTVIRRLGSAASSCFVGTVHSFLYKNVVKPYIGLIAEELDITPKKLEGYDDSVIGDFNFLKLWKEETEQKYLLDNNALVRALGATWWTLDKNKNIVLTNRPKKFIKVNGKSLKKGSALKYKQMAWKRGVFHPDDIFYFSIKLLNECPIISKVLVAKFPYLFVDEFQDSNPLQVKIFQHFAEIGIFVGIIGDTAQSIYGFSGASPDDFKNFKAPRIQDYVIRQNRRSSNEVILLLNHIRTDILQIPVRQVSMGVPELLVGTKQAALGYVKTRVLSEIVMLSRNNQAVQELRSPARKSGQPNLFAEMATHDSNFERRELVRITVTALVQAKNLGLAHAGRNLPKVLESSWGSDAARKYATVFLLEILEDYATYESFTLSQFIDYLRKDGALSITGLTPGKSAKNFYDSYLFSDMANQVLADDKANNRTIHKSKGDEFENVLLFLDQEQVNILVKPEIFKLEEQRITYVAFSRARDRLFINVPILSDDQRKALPPVVSIKSV